MSVLGMLISVLSFAQTITVTDEATLQPINGVYIYAKTSTVLTNSKGQADLTSFSKTDSLWFSHVGYKLKSYSYKQLEALQFKVAMSEVAFAIDEVIVSASRFEESSKDVAQPVKVLKAAELQFMNQQTMADVMQSSGQVLVQKSQLGGGSPIIRGFETNKVLMVVDGVRMNNAIYRGGHLQNIITLDNTIMDKVEIVFGPGSVVYGSDALGGVMHFYTRNPLLNDGDGIRTEVQAFTRYSTAYNEKTGHVNFNIAGKRFGSLTSFTYSDFGDLRQGNVRNPFYGDWGKRTFYAARVDGKDSMMVNENHNIQKVSGYKQYDILQKFMFQQNERVSHILNLQFSTSSDVPRYDRLTQVSGGLPRFAEWYYGPQERLFASYTLNLSGQTKLYDNARVIAGFQQIEESRNNRRFNNDKRNSRVENLNIFTFNADFAKKMNKHELRYGVDAWYNDVQSTASSENIVTGEISAIDTRYPDGGSSMQSVSAYLTHSWEISDKLILNDGLRVSNVALNAQFNDTTFFPFPFSSVDQNNNALNGNIGLVYMPGSDWRFTALASSGFRAPNVDDLSKVFESVAGSVVVPNPELGPEFTYNIDLGMSKTIDKKVTIGGTAYYTWYRNAITTQPALFSGQDSILYDGELSAVTNSANAREAYIYGFNAYLNASITSKFSITNTVTYTYGRIKTDTTDYPLDHIPPVFGKTSFLLQLKKFKGEFFVMYNSAKLTKNYNLQGEDNQAFSADPVNGYTPAWITLNVRTAYQFTKNIRLQVALENILDQNYRVYSSNISAAGRNLVVTLRGSF